MSRTQTIQQYLARYPSVSVGAYVALVAMLIFFTLLGLLDIAEHYSALNAAADRLAALEERTSSPLGGTGWPAGAVPPGSPFLEGQTVTVASAALLERITSAITRAGGTVLSSEIDPERQQSKDRYLRVIANCELEQSALQRLLYDLEAGMPFLFVDQLVAQAPSTENGRMHVLIGVSGLWFSEKS